MQGGLERAAKKDIDREKAALEREKYAARAAQSMQMHQVEIVRGDRHNHRGAALVDLLYALFR
jgi:hypothetical protein